MHEIIAYEKYWKHVAIRTLEKLETGNMEYGEKGKREKQIARVFKVTRFGKRDISAKWPKSIFHIFYHARVAGLKWLRTSQIPTPTTPVRQRDNVTPATLGKNKIAGKIVEPGSTIQRKRECNQKKEYLARPWVRDLAN